jgi:hypothetical protein
MSKKNSNGTIGNRTLDLPVCSAVPQPTAPPRVPIDITTLPSLMPAVLPNKCKQLSFGSQFNIFKNF